MKFLLEVWRQRMERSRQVQKTGAPRFPRSNNCGLDGQAIASVLNPPPRKYGPPWSAEELKQLRTLYPTHSASAIAAELGRPFNSVRSKAQKLGLKRDGPPKVIVKSTLR
jgi:hypothetical protein